MRQAPPRCATAPRLRGTSLRGAVAEPADAADLKSAAAPRRREGSTPSGPTCAPCDPPVPACNVAPMQPAVAESPRILLVDDSTLIRSVLADELREVGFDVDVASSNAKALEAIAHRPPDVAILDL